MFSYSAVVDQTRQVYLVENLPPPLKMKNLNNYSVIDKKWQKPKTAWSVTARDKTRKFKDFLIILLIKVEF